MSRIDVCMSVFQETPCVYEFPCIHNHIEVINFKTNGVGRSELECIMVIKCYMPTCSLSFPIILNHTTELVSKKKKEENLQKHVSNEIEIPNSW
jgi:hypothetical protein